MPRFRVDRYVVSHRFDLSRQRLRIHGANPRSDYRSGLYISDRKHYLERQLYSRIRRYRVPRRRRSWWTEILNI